MRGASSLGLHVAVPELLLRKSVFLLESVLACSVCKQAVCIHRLATWRNLLSLKEGQLLESQSSNFLLTFTDKSSARCSFCSLPRAACGLSKASRFSFSNESMISSIEYRMETAVNIVLLGGLAEVQLTVVYFFKRQGPNTIGITCLDQVKPVI